jgi:hypothetical protein
MGTVQIIRYVVQCDGCNAVFGTPVGELSPMDVRAAAYAQGWRFPNTVNRRTEAKQSGTSDVCPDCLPTWKPQSHVTQQRRATDEEVRSWT